jgi:hypothetical protein
MAKSIKLPNTLTGISGEYFVAGELSRRGYMASITLRNNDRVDIHASNTLSNKIFAIQVKTNQSGKRAWILNKKVELSQKENFFYVFVSLKGELERPEYFIVPSKKVAEFIINDHKKWLSTPGIKGQAHKDNNMRKFHDPKGEYLERWELLS